MGAALVYLKKRGAQLVPCPKQKAARGKKGLSLELTPLLLLTVCPLVFLAGFVDAVAGGGGLISLPAYLLAGLPAHLAATDFADRLAPQKDIDGMSNINAGNLFLCKTWAEVQALKGFVPCTAAAVIRLLQYHNISPEGAEAAVIGRSSTVGRPLAHLLTCQNATVKICHTKTDLPRALKDADLVCSAAGAPGLIDAAWLRPGATLIDISTNWKNDRLCGDADPQALQQRGVSYSPVPGGVGPVTLAVLLENIILSGERKLKENV